MKQKVKSVTRAVLKWTLFVAVAAFVARYLWRQISQARFENLVFDARFLFAALAATVLTMLARVWSFTSLMRPFHRPPGNVPMMVATWLPQMGKYVPGKVASIAAMVWLLKSCGVPGQTSLSVVFMLNVLMIAVGIAVSAPLALWEPVRTAFPGAWVVFAACLAVALIVLHPVVFKSVGNFLLRRTKRPQLEKAPSLTDFIGPVVSMLAQYAFLGLSVYFTLRAVVAAPWGIVGMLTSAVAFASVMGFVAIFAPAGLGVREGILLFLLNRMVDAPAEVAVAVILVRLLHTAVEVALALVALALMPRALKCSPTEIDKGRTDDV